MILVYSQDKGLELGKLLCIGPDRRGLPYRFVALATTEALRKSFKNNVCKFSQQKTTQTYVAIENKSIIGLVQVRPQEWESRILGVDVFALDVIPWDGAEDMFTPGCVRKAINYVRSISPRALITTKVWTSETRIIRFLLGKGFSLVDTSLEMVMVPLESVQSNGTTHSLPKEFSIRLADLRDQEALRVLAGEAFADHFGRFHSDANIDKKKATEIYQEWIVSCLQGWADFVFLAEDSETSRPAGFSAWKKPTPIEESSDLQIGHYSIGAVSPSFANKGLFKCLTLAGTEALKNCQAIEGPTSLRNIPVQRGYFSLGWKIADSRHILHFWT